MNWQVKFLALAYFVAEVAINYSLYGQLSVGSNQYAIESLEMWGKIITGLGAALLIIQVVNLITDESYEEDVIVGFIAICVLTIPLSFYVQEKIVDGIVDRASEQQLNNALLLVATKSTLVPYYNYSMASYQVPWGKMDAYDKVTYPFRNKRKIAGWEYVNNEEKFFKLADTCTQGSELALDVHQGIDKALFAYKKVRSKSTIEEVLYKDLIKEFYGCLYSDKDYSAAHSKGFKKGNAIKNQHTNYRLKNREYANAMEKAKRFGDNRVLEKIDRAWRTAANKEMGFNTSIGPGLSLDEFYAHPDVKRAFLRKAGKDAVWPFGDDWDNYVKRTVLSALPDNVLVGYKNQDGTVIKAKEYKEVEDEPLMINGEVYVEAQAGTDPRFKDGKPPDKILDGRGAYKSIVVPIIGLGLSAFFLVFNFISTGTFVLASHSKVVATAFFVIALIWVIFWPSYALSQAAESEYDSKAESILNDNYSEDDSTLLNILHYHEKNLGKIYEFFY